MEEDPPAEPARDLHGGQPPRLRHMWLRILIGLIASLVLVLAGILALALGNIAGVRQMLRSARLWPDAITSAQPGETLIVIAPFEHLDGAADEREAAQLQRAINEQLSTLGLSTMRVGVDDGAPIPAEDRAAAHALGERYHASMVIWGTQSHAQVRVHLLNLSQPDIAAAHAHWRAETQMENILIAGPLSDYTINVTDLPRYLAFFSTYIVGQAIYCGADYAGAAQQFAAALALVPADQRASEGISDVYTQLAWLQQMSGVESEQVLQTYTQAITLYPDAHAYLNRGLVRWLAHDLAGAMNDESQVIGIDPQRLDAYVNRGYMRHTHGDAAGALADFDKAVALDPQSTAAYMGRALMRQGNGDLDGALKDLDQALKLDPNNVPASFYRGGVRYATHDLGGALKDYDQVLALDPSNIAAYNNRGIIRVIFGDREGAMADYNKAIELNQQFALAYVNRAALYRAKADMDAAIADDTQALSIDPKQIGALSGRCMAWYAKGELERAVADCSHAIELDPTYVQAYYIRGLVYQQQKQRELAIADYRKIIELVPDPVGNEAAFQRLRELGVEK